MTRLFFNFFILPMAILLAAQNILRADALDKSAVLENDVAYLRVASVGKNLTEEIRSAQTGLGATNKIDGTILDLRFAGGDDLDSEKAAANLFASKKPPLAILVNDKTRGAAAKLAADLREAHDGLIFGDSTEIKPDIAIAVKMEDEKKFFENPYANFAQPEINSPASTNNFSSFIDHTTEADLVRAKIKDGDQDESLAAKQPAEPQKPFIHDPVLAGAVDLIKGLAIVRQPHA
jgi:C-terminal processing protease CtpA/Prc